MNKVKITVLKTTLDKELAEEYGVPGLTACPMMQAGHVFYADYAKPDGLCDEAWKAIYQYVFALAHGSGNDVFYYGDWILKYGGAISAAVFFISVPKSTRLASCAFWYRIGGILRRLGSSWHSHPCGMLG